MANEYDFLLDIKPVERWDRFFEVVHERDPHRRLTSIHQGMLVYDHARPEISHVSIQTTRVEETKSFRDKWGKPVINDEPQYEGDIPNAWGNISAQELVHRFWVTAAQGGYAGHGETYFNDEHQLWWAKGGALHGQSPARIAFLRGLMEASPGPWEPAGVRTGGAGVDVCDAGPGERIIYLGHHQPISWWHGLPQDGRDFRVDLIDPWAMTIEPLEVTDPPYYRFPRHVRNGELVTGRKLPVAGVELPGRPYLALRVRWE
jgi:hypothetical protein